MTIVTAIPEVKPVVIVNGINLISEPKWQNPMITRDDTCHDRRNCQSFHAALRHDTCHDRCKCRR